MVTGLGSCGLVRAADETQRSYVVTVQRENAMTYLEKQLAQWEQYGFLSWRLAAA
jgi:hypothetical protein